MRNRLVLGAVALLAFALVLVAVPLGIATRSQHVDQALDTLSAEVQQLGRVIDSSRTCAEVQFALTFLSQQTGRDTAVALLAEDGNVVLARDGRTQVVVGPEATDAFGGSTGKAFREGRLAAATPLSTRACNTALVLQADRAPDEVERLVRRSWLQLGGLGLLVLAAGAGAAGVMAKRLAEPMQDLARSAAALGDGDVGRRAPRTGLEEMDQIADALDLTADRLGRALGRSASFAMDFPPAQDPIDRAAPAPRGAGGLRRRSGHRRGGPGRGRPAPVDDRRVGDTHAHGRRRP